MSLSRAQAAALMAMGPSARHASPAAVADRLAALAEPLTATIAVTLRAYTRLPEPRS